MLAIGVGLTLILLLAWIVIGEYLSPERISGIALIVFALFLSHWRPPRVSAREAEVTGD